MIHERWRILDRRAFSKNSSSGKALPGIDDGFCGVFSVAVLVKCDAFKYYAGIEFLCGALR
jgi:hypothetical protein